MGGSGRATAGSDPSGHCGAERQLREIRAAGMTGSAHPFRLGQDALRVHLVDEAPEEARTRRVGGFPGVALGVEAVGGDAGSQGPLGGG